VNAKSDIRDFASFLQELDWVNQTYVTWIKNPRATTDNSLPRFTLQDITVDVIDQPFERCLQIEQFIEKEPLRMTVDVTEVEYYAHDAPTEVILIDPCVPEPSEPFSDIL